MSTPKAPTPSPKLIDPAAPPPTPCGPPPVDYMANALAFMKDASANYVYTVAEGPNPCGLTDMSRIATGQTPEEQTQIASDIEGERAPTLAPLTPTT